MEKRLWLNLGLLAAVAVLAAVAFFEPGKEEPKTVYLLDFDEDSIDRIELKGKDSLLFQKRDGHWWLTAPFQAPANEIRVRQLMEIGKAESEAHYPLTPEDKAKFDLDPPKTSLTLGSLQLLFGGSDPIDMRRYIQVGDTLHLVNDDFSHHLSAQATDWVEKKLLPDEAKPNEIFLPGLKLRLGADSKWSAEPTDDAGEGISELVQTWQSARAIDVKRIQQPLQGDVIRVGFSNHDPVEFIIVQREPDLLLARTDWGLQYQVTAESAKHLLSLQKPDGKAPGAVETPAAGATEDEVPDSGDDAAGGEPDETGSETEGMDVEE